MLVVHPNGAVTTLGLVEEEAVDALQMVQLRVQKDAVVDTVAVGFALILLLVPGAKVLMDLGAKTMMDFVLVDKSVREVPAFHLLILSRVMSI